MTKQRNETPAKKAKRVRINEDENEVQIIRVETPNAAPSLAARDHVKAAVASHPEAIQRIAIALSKESVSLQAKLLQKSTTKTKLDSDPTFIPRSAKVGFKLTAPQSIMETTDFKTLSAAMDEKTKEYSEFCKKSIARVAELVNEGMKKDIRDHFHKGFLQLSTLLLIQQDPTRKVQPVDHFMLFVLTDLDQSIFDYIHATKIALQTELMEKINRDSDAPATQLTVVFPPEYQGLFALLKPHLHTLLATVFVDSFAKYKKTISDNETKKCLERQATQFLTGAATAATAMEIDAEPSADPKLIRDLITKVVNDKTSKMQTELQKLRDSVNRTPEQKNSRRGAPSSSEKSSASLSNKNGKREKKNSGNKNANKGDDKPKASTLRKKENSDAPNAQGLQKGKNQKPKKNGTPSKKSNATKQQPHAKRL